MTNFSIYKSVIFVVISCDMYINSILIIFRSDIILYHIVFLRADIVIRCDFHFHNVMSRWLCMTFI